MTIIVEVSGGVCQDVHAFGSDFSWNGCWEVLDWDDIESDPEQTWAKMPVRVKNFVQANYPDEYARYEVSHASHRV